MKRSGAKRGDFERMDVRRRISARRLIDGGPAMFVTVAMNHHRHIEGRRVRKPLVTNILRVLVVSALTPARENRAGEESPWASIIARAPFHPQEDIDVIPAIANPMCATDE